MAHKSSERRPSARKGRFHRYEVGAEIIALLEKKKERELRAGAMTAYVEEILKKFALDMLVPAVSGHVLLDDDADAKAPKDDAKPAHPRKIQ